MKKTKVVAGFSGIGKTCFKRHENEKGVTCLDSDSFKFSWLPETKEGKRVRNPNFVEDYIRHIEIIKNANVVDYIFVSTHEYVRKELIKRGLLDILVYPSIERKEEYLASFKKYRISDCNSMENNIQKNIYNLLDLNYEEWVKNCQEEKGVTKIELATGIYLKDIL